MRAEFSKAVKRAALKRSGGFCEAGGAWYGLLEGQRCGASLERGVEYDHVDLEANSHDASLENCCCACPPCHRYKTRKRDIPVAAKTLRQQDKHVGIRKSPYNWPKRKFPTRADRERALAKMERRT